MKLTEYDEELNEQPPRTIVLPEDGISHYSSGSAWLSPPDFDVPQEPTELFSVSSEHMNHDLTFSLHPDSNIYISVGGNTYRINSDRLIEVLTDFGVIQEE